MASWRKPSDSRHELATKRSAPRQHHAAHALLRHLIALLESQPDTPFLGQIKTLLTGPELPVASDVAVPWDIAYFIEHLRAQLQPGSAGVQPVKPNLLCVRC